jgi:transcriptional regulator with GAF, ATPase, and Fis domain/pSer/pThr/pTyr-binding forkhead associated (FHA) protein
MPAGADAYLVIRRNDGFEVLSSLTPGLRYTLGRANTNRIVLKDEQCSREHAEVYYADDRWCVRDLKSLNGTRINGVPLDSEWELSAKDEIHLGRTHLVFLEDMTQLSGMPVQQTDSEGVSIKKRLGHTRFLTPLPPSEAKAEAYVPTPTPTDRLTPKGPDQTVPPPGQHSLYRELSLLYRLALDMGSAADQDELVAIVLDGLLEATPADVGAILEVEEDRELRKVAHRNRDDKGESYKPVSAFLSNDVLDKREAILAEDVAEDRHLRSRESLSDIGATSLICAPVIFREKVLALIHLYCTDSARPLNPENLEFAMALAQHLGAAMHQMKRQDSLAQENQSLRDQLRVESELVGESSAIKAIESQVARVAGTNATVLIRGESGVGKELVARAIHLSSPRREAPFVCLNCAALSETLLESELFGHEKGAFTGATDKKIGKFEAADHGTIFLDEIGEMTTGTQAKLLRVLEGHPFERVGGSTPIRVDVRVVSATNQPLEQALQSGAFRRDLFFRLQVVEIRVPALSERRSDIPLLAEHFLKRFVRETGRKVKGFTPAALKKMEDYHWPGNVRELRNVVERAVALSLSSTLDASDIWLSSLEVGGPVPLNPESVVYQPVSLEEKEKQHILQTLRHTDWNKSQAATILGIERSTLDRKIKAYDLRR